MARHPFAAVNLISDPIHGYIELTKRLEPDESAAAGLPDEEVAEEDLLDTAWLQRLRRISQLQSARWVFPTAEHSRFTHGLGVMHEAGLWARSLYPSLRTTLVAAGEPLPSEGLVVETLRMAGLLHDVGHGPFAHFFDDHVLAALQRSRQRTKTVGAAKRVKDSLCPRIAVIYGRIEPKYDSAREWAATAGRSSSDKPVTVDDYDSGGWTTSVTAARKIE
jgi:HD superfamily phosphohydrolase